MRIIFMGTPEFAVPSLQALCNSHHTIVAVVTQLDKPVGRSGKLVASPVKHCAISNNIPVYQFKSIKREGVEIIKNLDADIIVTCAYGQILTADILFAKKYGVINVHGSLLPKYRGASPIQSAIINGETETGITILKSDIGIDDGDIILEQKTTIEPNETYGELANRLAILGANTLLKALEQIENGTAVYNKQDDSVATHCSMFDSNYGKLDFNNSAKNIVNLINGLNPSPVAYMVINGKRFKVYKAHIFDNSKYNYDCIDKANGTVLVAHNKIGLLLKANDGIVAIDQIQAEGGKILNYKDFLNGGKIAANDVVSYE